MVRAIPPFPHTLLWIISDGGNKLIKSSLIISMLYLPYLLHSLLIIKYELEKVINQAVG